MSDLQQTIETAFDARDTISPSTVTAEVKAAVDQSIALLKKLMANGSLINGLKKLSYYIFVVTTMTLLMALKRNILTKFL